MPGQGRGPDRAAAGWFGHCRDRAQPRAHRPTPPTSRRRSARSRGSAAASCWCRPPSASTSSAWCAATSRARAGRVPRARHDLRPPLPAGLRDGAPLAPPLFTPSTKAEHGPRREHRLRTACAPSSAADWRAGCASSRLALYGEARGLAAPRGVILADTKFEFGDVDGRVTLIDEALTPDSSRFWDAAAVRRRASRRRSTSSSCATTSNARLEPRAAAAAAAGGDRGARPRPLPRGPRDPVPRGGGAWSTGWTRREAAGERCSRHRQGEARRDRAALLRGRRPSARPGARRARSPRRAPTQRGERAVGRDLRRPRQDAASADPRRLLGAEPGRPRRAGGAAWASRRSTSSSSISTPSRRPSRAACRRRR